MRFWITLIALVGFVLQQFACCELHGDHCAAWATSAEIQHVYVHSHDDHHHDDDHNHPSTSDHPHRLCVGTHLFFLTRSHTDAPQPDSNPVEAAVSLQPVLLDAVQCASECVIASRAVPPPGALRLRASLNVWTV